MKTPPMQPAEIQHAQSGVATQPEDDTTRSHNGPAEHAAERRREPHPEAQGSRDRVLANWGKQTSQAASLRKMRSLVQNLQLAPGVGEVPAHDDTAWPAISDFDAQRRAGKDSAAMLGHDNTQLLRAIAEDAGHPCHADAKLLSDIISRPLDANAPSLETYLAGVVSTQVKATISDNFDTSPKPDFNTRDGVFTFVRTFNGILQGVSLNSQDYAATGRSLILHGSTHLATAMGKPDSLESDALSSRLKNAVFCFPTVPEEGKAKLELKDFNTDFNPEIMDMDPNPLEVKFGREVYLDAQPFLAGAKDN